MRINVDEFIDIINTEEKKVNISRKFNLSQDRKMATNKNGLNEIKTQSEVVQLTENLFNGRRKFALKLIPTNSFYGEYQSWANVVKLLKTFNSVDCDHFTLRFYAKLKNELEVAINSESEYLALLKSVLENKGSMFIVMNAVNIEESSSQSENDLDKKVSKRANCIGDNEAMTKPSNAQETAASSSDDISSKMEEKIRQMVTSEIAVARQELTKEITHNVYCNLISALRVSIEPGSKVENVSSSVCGDEKPKDTKVKFLQPVEGAKAGEEEVVHKCIICDNCETEIKGIRYKCNQCLDFDLCSKCEALSPHDETHIFSKIKKPIRFMCPGMLRKNSKVEVKRDGNGIAIHLDDLRNNLFLCGSRPQRPKTINVQSNDAESRKRPFQREIFGHRFNYYKYTSFLNGVVIQSSLHSPIVRLGTQFNHTWTIRNVGVKRWSDRVTLRMYKSDAGLETENGKKEVPVPPLRPGEEGEVSVMFVVTKTDGSTNLSSHWRLYHGPSPFGEMLLCHVLIDKSLKDGNAESVPTPEVAESEQQKQSISMRQVILSQEKPNLEAALAAYEATAPMKKIDVKSHTATPTNTPFDVSPPKSPVPASCDPPNFEPLEGNAAPCNPVQLRTFCGGSPVRCEIQTPSDDANVGQSERFCLIDSCSSASSTPSRKNDLNMNDRLIGVDNLNEFGYSSSDSSSEEFCIVPLPVCFDLNAPFPVTEDETMAKVNVGNEQAENVNILSNCICVEAPKIQPLNDEQIIALGRVDLTEVSSSENVKVENDLVKDTLPKEEMTPKATTVGFDPDVIPPTSSGNTVAADEPKETDNGYSTNPFLNDRQHSSETVINVLPERIVDGALNAAAQVVHGLSRAFLSAQNLGAHDFQWITSPPPAIIPMPYHRAPDAQSPSSTTNEAAASSESSVNETTNAPSLSSQNSNESNLDSQRLVPAMDKLFEMGFLNVTLNERLLLKYNYDVNDVVEELLTTNHQAQQQPQEEVVSTQPRHSLPRIEEFD